MCACECVCVRARVMWVSVCVRVLVRVCVCVCVCGMEWVSAHTCLPMQLYVQKTRFSQNLPGNDKVEILSMMCVHALQDGPASLSEIVEHVRVVK